VSSSALGKLAKCAKCGQQFSVAELKPRQAGGGTTGAQQVLPAPAKSVDRQALPQAAHARSAKSAQPASPSSDSVSPNAARTRTRLTEKVLMAAFHERFPRTRPRLSYRVGILLVALAMVVLPVIYLAFIGLVAFGVYYHAVNHTAMLSMGYGRASIFLVVAYAAPLIAGPIAVLFMIKPLLARPIRHERSRSLTPQNEPLLFAFIGRICEEVGAPRPKRLDVDCSINAGASFRRGIFSMFGSDLVLTIGLPLAAGLSLREFAGVMAHELGHFAQGVGMRLSYMIRSTVDWFIRVVYQRDEWDEWLEETAQDVDFRIGWIFLVAHLFVLIGRGILWLLLHVGLLITGLMLRQMEYDADGYQARFAGSAAFADTMRKLHLLNSASQFALMQLSASLDHRKLVDNLPVLIAYHARQRA
jgi:Zn-dependent protease with chaperone function